MMNDTDEMEVGVLSTCTKIPEQKPSILLANKHAVLNLQTNKQ